MNWFLIDKTSATQPARGGYKDWKPLLATEGKNQCVYCTIHEQSFGGERNFHVEHFKPKSHPRFADLKDNYANLFYACAICNTFKGSAWPGTVPSDFSRSGFIDPSRHDYCGIFSVDLASGEVSAPNRAGRYMLEQLYLNRAQLILDRKIAIAEQRVLSEEAQLRSLLKDWAASGYPSSAGPLVKKITEALGDIVKLQIHFKKLRPYDEKAVRRPRKTKQC